MCVARPYFGSSAEMVRKSELTASTLLQCAFDSMVLRVEYRLRSRSNAYNFGDCHQCPSVERNQGVADLALVLHDGAEV